MENGQCIWTVTIKCFHYLVTFAVLLPLTLAIRLLKTEDEVRKLVKPFFNVYGVPQCLGAVDGTHIQMKQPKYNRTSYYSLNVQACCNYEFCVVVKWPGSVHDARILANSKLNFLLCTHKIPPCPHNEDSIPVFVLGNPGYPLLLYLMKEYTNCVAPEMLLSAHLVGLKLDLLL